MELLGGRLNVSHNKGVVSISTKSADIKSAIEKDGSQWFYPVGAGASFQFGAGNDAARMSAFCTVPEVNAIFNLRARAHGNVRLITVDLKGKPIEKESIYVDLLENPNYFQSKQEFFGQTNLFRDIFGDEIIHTTVPLGMTRPTGIFSLPIQDVDIKSRDGESGTGPFYLETKLPSNIVYFYKDTNGKSYELRHENILHLNDNNIKLNRNVELVKGMSKLDALGAPIANIKAAYEARNVLIVNRGAIGILSNASKDGIGGIAPMNLKEKDKIQEQFKRYGISKGQWQVIITNLALHWQQMAIDVDKLKLFEETREDTLKICDSYGTPYEMLSAIRNTTFNNKKSAQLQWYRDTIMPEANARIAGINRQYNTVADGYRMLPDFTHLPIFETEKKERAQSLLLTVNALTKALEDKAITIDQYKKELKKFEI
ncbi:MAG: phage portal protein [Candidatus Peribacteraceae bacterium]|nr:phage portal protein [Candidatus Peribacteraceae bacterium]